jgi:hypothetical protein
LWSSISWLNSAGFLFLTKLLQFTTINLMLLCVTLILIVNSTGYKYRHGNNRFYI